jgi:transcriptional regulator with XRE-family HTH domain
MRSKASQATEETWQARLVEAMEARGLSGGELARRAGFTAQYVNSLKNGERGGRLTIETARKLSAALGVSVDWLVKGEGARERLSDVFPVAAPQSPASEYRMAAFREAPDPYPSRAEAIALLASVVAPEVIDALRATVPEGDADPGRAYWIAAAKSLARDFRRIKEDPDLGGGPPKSEYQAIRKK